MEEILGFKIKDDELACCPENGSIFHFGGRVWIFHLRLHATDRAWVESRIEERSSPVIEDE